MKSIWLFARKLMILNFLISPLCLSATVYEAGIGKDYTLIPDAIAAAKDGDTIAVFGTITANGQVVNGIVVNKSLTFIGQGPDSAIIEAAALPPPAANRRVLSILAGVQVIIKDITIRYGNTELNGGAIENLGDLSLINCRIVDNTAMLGGGIRNNMNAVLYIENCLISNNYASLRGGGINHLGSNLSINNTCIESNSAREQGGGIQIENASSYITNTLISDNQLFPDTISSNGAGIFIGNSTGANASILINVTISGNTGTPQYSCGGGVGMMSNAGTSTLSMINCTIADNYVSCGQGIQTYTYNSGTQNIIKLTNCIISNGLSDNYFAFQSGGSNKVIRNYTLLRDATISADGSGNTNLVDPQIEALADNGGPTYTHALKSGSPAIDAGTSTGTLPGDQRGASRTGKVDIGAFEYGGVISITDLTATSVQIYPNPVSHSLFINNNSNELLHITLMDINARTIHSEETNLPLYVLDMSALPEGMYMLLIQSTQHSMSAKVLKCNSYL